MDLLQQLVTIFAENGYVAVFIALMICGAGLPLPEDITLVAGGVIAGLGYANVHVMFALTMFGVLLGDCAIFLLGHHYGARILQWRFVARVLTPSRYVKVQEKFDHYGNRMLFFARFLPGMRTTVYLTAGTTHRVSFLRFLLIDTMAALISVPFWVYLGYFGANNHEWLVKWMHRGQSSLWVLIGLLLLTVLVLWWKHRRRTRCGLD
ncbi:MULTISPECIES: DedA family protein [Rhodanobacter]|jgi:membrane protein DedA with SNARE-associated domain|uniref:Alpha-amylase n=2 Tax=Rhodanobacter TaxID=75309 RepID=A0A154QHI5_9GAMM|nr:MULTISPECIES: DedA family protein [Rhodanobacter]AGG87464.1 putative membrane-associated protein [Rhodanobacter denitrificans]EIL99061.1 DedA protein family [Rhodanobacter denitrificans]KZC20871.1 alpha-amylase [Rhodanobacter denitrificans]KZC23312.1 alpha-amylase [Rhodanobacter thiooxydans]UJJ51381.1 DedA family protein [Rhodanobacter denitrificans]